MRKKPAKPSTDTAVVEQRKERRREQNRLLQARRRQRSQEYREKLQEDARRLRSQIAARDRLLARLQSSSSDTDDTSLFYEENSANDQTYSPTTLSRSTLSSRSGSSCATVVPRDNEIGRYISYNSARKANSDSSILQANEESTSQADKLIERVLLEMQSQTEASQDFGITAPTYALAAPGPDKHNNLRAVAVANNVGTHRFTPAFVVEQEAGFLLALTSPPPPPLLPSPPPSNALGDDANGMFMAQQLSLSPLAALTYSATVAPIQLQQQQQQKGEWSDYPFGRMPSVLRPIRHT